MLHQISNVPGGSAPDLAGTAYSTPPDPLAGGEGPCCPSPRTPLLLSALGLLFFCIIKHLWAPKRSWKISHGGPGKSWKSPGFFVSKRVGTLSMV